MQKFSLRIAVCLSVFTFAANSFAGQAIIVPLEELVDASHLVAVVEVKEVTAIEIPRGDGKHSSKVYVAHAQIENAIKPDHFPETPRRNLAIVGSSIPRSSAVWQPIEKGRYLAFLKVEQGHYHYGMLYAFRKIDDDKVPWYDKKDGQYVFEKLDLDEAIKRIKKHVD